VFSKKKFEHCSFINSFFSFPAVFLKKSKKQFFLEKYKKKGFSRKFCFL
jgi:hypothetical protein